MYDFETWAKRLPDAKEEIEFGLAALEPKSSVCICSTARLLGLLNLIHELGKTYIVRLPVNALQKNGAFQKKYEIIFTEQMFGMILSRMARAVLTHRGINVRDVALTLQQKRLTEQRPENVGAVSSGFEVAIPSFDTFGSPPRHTLLQTLAVPKSVAMTERKSCILNIIQNLVGFGNMGSEYLSDSRDATYEIIENTFDHGLLDTENNSIERARLIYFRRFNAHRETSAIFLGAERGFKEYLDRLESNAVYSGHVEKGLSMLEVTIVDSGSGISASMAKSMNIYMAPFAHEEEKFRAAMMRGGTSKSTHAAGSGHGLDIARVNVEKHHGYMHIRTGRVQSYTDQFGSAEPNRARPLVILKSTYLPGTAVTLLFPIPARGSADPQSLLFNGSNWDAK